jgi:DNA-binding LacI/PurR family transcriptional regulator
MNTNMTPNKKPTQSDVAKQAGVSPAIVSLVLNGRLDGNVRISNDTQERVWKAIRDLGYVPNLVARSLAGGQNHLLGVFTYESIFPLEQHDFYYPFLLGIEQEAEQQGYDLLLFTRANAANGQRAVFHQGVNRLKLADGAVLLGMNSDKEELARLQQEGFPFVYVGRKEVPEHPISYVAADYASATQQVVEHLLELEHRELLYLHATSLSESVQDREEGYRKAYARHKLPLPETAILRFEEGQPLQLEQWLTQGVTAIVCEWPWLAAQVYEAARGLGVDVPGELSVATLGESSSPSNPVAMTSFQIPRQQMGSEAVRLLLERLSNPKDNTPRRTVLPCKFVVGQTTAKARRGR